MQFRTGQGHVSRRCPELDQFEASSQFGAAWHTLRQSYTDADFALPPRARLDGMEADDVGNGPQASDPNPGRPRTVLQRCGD